MVWTKCGKPLLVQRHVIRTTRVKNSHFCALFGWNTKKITFTARVISLNHVCKTSWTGQFVGTILPPMCGFYATKALCCFSIIGLRHLLPRICLTFVPPTISTFFYIQTFVWRYFLCILSLLRMSLKCSCNIIKLDRVIRVCKSCHYVTEQIW